MQEVFFLTLTPKVAKSGKPIDMQPPAEVYDELKEQQELAERKARAEQIKARQEKQLKHI